MTLEFSGQTFEKSSNTKFHEIPSFGTPVVPCGRTDGQTDRHDEANSGFSQFCASRLKSVFEKRMFTAGVSDLHNDQSLME